MKLKFASLGLSLALCIGFASNASAATSPFGTKTPTQILALSEQAMTKAASVRLTGTATERGATLKSVLDTSLHESAQTTAGDGLREIVFLIGTKLMIWGNANYYSSQINVKDSPLANKWVLVPAGNPMYAPNASQELLQPLEASIFNLKSPTSKGIVTFDGSKAEAITGVLPKASAFAGSSETVYVSTGSRHRPIGYTIAIDSNGVAGTAKALFSHWGESVRVVSPLPLVVATSSDS